MFVFLSLTLVQYFLIMPCSNPFIVVRYIQCHSMLEVGGLFFAFAFTWGYK